MWQEKELNYYMVCSVSGQERGIKSCAVVGYPSGQDAAVLPGRDHPPRPARKIFPKAIYNYDKSFIDQDCSVKITCIGLVLILR